MFRKAQRLSVAVRTAAAIGGAAAAAAVIAVAAWSLRGSEEPSEELPRVAPAPAQTADAPVTTETQPRTSVTVALPPISTTAAGEATAGTSLDSTVDEAIEVAPEQYRVPLGPRDEPGALWVMRAPRHQSSGIEERVLDVCVRDDAVSAVLGRAAGPGQLLTQSEQERLQQVQWLAGCNLPEPHPDRSGRYVGWSLTRGTLSYHATYEDAATQLQAEQAVRRARRNTLPFEAALLGNVSIGSSSGPFDIEYSDASSPVDEVELIASSVNVADGVLRGMVRNRSRTLFAYGVTVTAGGTSWRWPLSMQPGELAPFEIEDWSGPSDPDAIAIAAEMSPDVDRSRAFLFFLLHEQAPYRYPPEVEVELESGDCIAPAGNGRHYAVELGRPWYAELDSHSSLYPHIYNLEIADFRVYVAFYDERTYGVHEVQQLHVLFPLSSSQVDYDDPDAAEFRIINSLPQPHPNPAATSVDYHAFMAFCNNHYTIGNDYTVWVGGAHPQHPAP
ncbi:hypothetical protein [Candidatus Poriferisodalis sp.]|uniref:hypothetical protein n=1 Tax=Candidatus Poriferisodalis sp. TaxID=3101277 RepID=UPI003B59231C